MMQRKPVINILLPNPKGRWGETWGDHYFGHSLRRAFEDIGVAARVIYRPRWPWLARFSPRRGIDLGIRGYGNFKPRVWPWATYYVWMISHYDLNEREISAVHHVFAASRELVADQIAAGRSASYLPQCTDRHVFSPERRQADLATDVLFVGSRRESFERDIVHAAAAAGFPPKVWGNNWRRHYPIEHYGGRWIANAELGAHYASAKVVLNDHMAVMKAKGVISNRVYDVLASGAALVSDALPDLGRALPGTSSAPHSADVGPAIARALAAYENNQSDRHELAAFILEHHTFHERAQSILDVLALKST